MPGLESADVIQYIYEYMYCQKPGISQMFMSIPTDVCICTHTEATIHAYDTCTSVDDSTCLRSYSCLVVGAADVAVGASSHETKSASKHHQ